MAKFTPAQRESAYRAYWEPRWRVGITWETAQPNDYRTFDVPTLRSVAATHGMSLTWAWLIVQREAAAQREPHYVRRPHPLRERGLIVAAYVKGWPMTRITTRWRLSRQYVWMLARQAGVAPRRTGVRGKARGVAA